MKYQVGDRVRIMRHRPIDIMASPSWHYLMDKFLGKEGSITKNITNMTNANFYEIKGWIFREEWLEPITQSSLEERICTKIKELDNKWRKRTANEQIPSL